jgi:hypothetical protein
MKTPNPFTNCIHSSSKRSAVLYLSLLIACFAPLPKALAVTPAPDGAYGRGNTAEGEDALFSLGMGYFNTAIGFHALYSDTTGSGNTAVGDDALPHDTEGRLNAAIGFETMHRNTTGELNTATGRSALANNTTGDANTADGAFALSGNTTGESNTAIGYDSMHFSTTGVANTAVGRYALNDNTTGSGNVALGFQAGMNTTTGLRNIYIGADIRGAASDEHACYIGSIFGQTSADGIPVLINQNNKLGTTTSSKRFKQDIKPMDKAGETLYALKPVSFRYKKEIDPNGTSQLGLVAEDVEKVDPDLVVRDTAGKPYTVRYDQVNAMLLNEFLKEHQTVQELKANAARQQKEIAALTAGLQRVSAQLETSPPTRHVVVNQE